MLESQSHACGITLPRLRWARKDPSVPDSTSQLSIAFDSFDTRVDFVPLTEIPAIAPLHVYGLVATTQRSFQFQPTPQWLSWVSPDSNGEKHPVVRTLTERLSNVNSALM